MNILDWRINTSDQETLYIHALQLYIPGIANITFDKHVVGFGIFIIQGFDWQNKVNKNTLFMFSKINET